MREDRDRKLSTAILTKAGGDSRNQGMEFRLWEPGSSLVAGPGTSLWFRMELPPGNGGVL